MEFINKNLWFSFFKDTIKVIIILIIFKNNNNIFYGIFK